MRIAIIGTGAVGLYYAAKLQRAAQRGVAMVRTEMLHALLALGELV